ncbi:Rop guanine nucleotide exchange factor 9 [Zea mays]|uniref:Rop guanine nucleotide exchange factor 9 n=1 Tax=Zea mays TaxID=4577 RepID=A0A1D6MCH1_MAIZE|nr:Rop guanine nucleotide exchange factor 9 [Zea mays]
MDAQAQPFTRRALSRSCGSKGSRLSVDHPPPPLAGGPSADKGVAGSSSSLAVPPEPARREGPPSDAEKVREKFSKLLLGEDMSGTGKGVTSALALSNAITNLAASVFGEQRRLQPMADDQKSRWKKEVDWLLSVADHIVEFVPSQQVAENGTSVEIMITQQRQDLQMNIPALRKLDAMLLEYLDSFAGKQEFWYASKDADGPGKGSTPRQDDKWWLPTVRVPPDGLSGAYSKWLQNQKDLVAQVLKAAMAINANVLMEMEVPESYTESLPKNGKSTLGDSVYRLITDDHFDPEELLRSVDSSDEHSIVDLKNRIEASAVIWQKKMTHNKDSKLPWGHSHEKRGMFEGRAENVLLLIKHRFPGIAQSALDISKIQCNKDVGLAILESYSRTLESLAFTVMSRIEDVLSADLAARDLRNTESMRIAASLASDDTDKVVSDAKAEVEKTGRMEPVSPALSDLVGPKLTKISPVATKRFSYLENLGGTRSPIARH